MNIEFHDFEPNHTKFQSCFGGMSSFVSEHLSRGISYNKENIDPTMG
jgi:hypothetical protein